MKRLLLIALVLQTSYSLAADKITIGTPAYGGNGCPQGTASATVSDDGQSLTVLFDQFIAEAGGATRKSFDRKACNVAIPVHVPQGFSVSIFQIDFRGSNELPQGASTQFNVEYFFAGSQGLPFRKVFRGPLSREFRTSHELEATSLIWSKCGEDVILRSNASIKVKTNDDMEQAATQIDSQDVKAGIVYLFQWKRCR